MDEINSNRLEEFRQLKEEVRHSEEYLIVGIDIAKDRHYAFFGTATGKTLLKRIVPFKPLQTFKRVQDLKSLRALAEEKKLKRLLAGMFKKPEEIAFGRQNEPVLFR